MPIEKFRSLDEMRRALWRHDSDQTLFKRIRALWLRSWDISPKVYPHGVFKYRTIEEAQQARRAREKRNG
ncbi:MAG: hypothetical protein ACR2L2_13245 [Acidobacteriota bacterium]